MNFTVPQGRHKSGDKQLCCLCLFLAGDLSAYGIGNLRRLRWSDTKVAGQHKDRCGFGRRTTEECAAGHGRKEGKSGDMDSFFGKTCGFCIIFRNFGRIIRDRFRRRRTKPGRSGFSGRETADDGKCKRTANRKRGTQARNEAATANGDRKTKRRLQTRKRPQTQRR